MGAEPGRPNELSPIIRIDTARVRPFKARPAAASSSPARRGRTRSIEDVATRYAGCIPKL